MRSLCPCPCLVPGTTSCLRPLCGAPRAPIPTPVITYRSSCSHIRGMQNRFHMLQLHRAPLPDRNRFTPVCRRDCTCARTGLLGHVLLLTLAQGESRRRSRWALAAQGAWMTLRGKVIAWPVGETHPSFVFPRFGPAPMPLGLGSRLPFYLVPYRRSPLSTHPSRFLRST